MDLHADRRISVFLAADGSFAEHALTTVHSVLKHCTHPVDTYLLTDASAECRGRMDQLHRAFGGRVIFVSLDSLADFVPSDLRFRQAVYGRLFVTGLVPDSVKRLIYLDTDVLVRKCLAPLADLAMDGVSIAATDCHSAVKDREFTASFGGRYFNSGVLVMNMEHIRQTNTLALEQVWSALRGEMGPLRWRDQCVLNRLCADWKNFGISWNFGPQLGAKHAGLLGLTREAFEAVERDPSIYHFLGPAKPWTSGGTSPGHRFQAEWQASALECSDLLAQAPTGTPSAAPTA